MHRCHKSHAAAHSNVAALHRLSGFAAPLVRGTARSTSIRLNAFAAPQVRVAARPASLDLDPLTFPYMKRDRSPKSYYSLAMSLHSLCGCAFFVRFCAICVFVGFFVFLMFGCVSFVF